MATVKPMQPDHMLHDGHEREQDQQGLSLLELPETIVEMIALYLPTRDVLSFVCTNRATQRLAPGIWKSLLRYRYNENAAGETTDSLTASSKTDPNESQKAKETVLLRSYVQELPAVQWTSISSRTEFGQIASREGHVSCLLGENREMFVLTGGFTNDGHVYVHAHGEWHVLVPSGNSVGFCYGASLTRINAAQAVLYGGFRSGGYHGECTQVAVLTLRIGSSTENGTMEETSALEAHWEVIAQDLPPGKELASWRAYMGRAYHTSTLIGDRYLLMIGGMQGHRSILNLAMLDTETWTWVDDSVLESENTVAPSARFGHSVVLDEKRNRLVLFGGGYGSDLLRSGKDNSEVWCLHMNGYKQGMDITASFPWSWELLNEDQHEKHQLDALNRNNQGEDTVQNTPTLSLVDILTLGRCHVAHKVGVDTVLFAFGSGRPSTNGLLAYNLASHTFFRPGWILGALPMTRFTCASEFMLNRYLIVHGGYSSRRGSTLGDFWALDLAPALQRKQSNLTGNLFPFVVCSPQPRSSAPVSEEEVRENIGFHQRARHLHGGLMQLIQMYPDDMEVGGQDEVGAWGLQHIQALMANAMGGYYVVNAEDDDDDDNDEEEEYGEDDDNGDDHNDEEEYGEDDDNGGDGDEDYVDDDNDDEEN